MILKFGYSINYCQYLSHGGGQMVSVVAFYSNDPNPNPAEAISFSVNFVFDNNENKQKRGLGWPIWKNKTFVDILTYF